MCYLAQVPAPEGDLSVAAFARMVLQQHKTADLTLCGGPLDLARRAYQVPGRTPQTQPLPCGRYAALPSTPLIEPRGWAEAYQTEHVEGFGTLGDSRRAL